MPLTIPAIDDRKYQDLLDEALARIPVHNPEWTNFNKSDPGVTLIELFAFMAENLLYRSNQIPERNRLKFLQLLGVPLAPASSARGIVTFTNERGPLTTVMLNANLEVRAGQVPFRTEQALDVLPVEGRVYYKRPVGAPSAQRLEYYRQLYASYRTAASAAAGAASDAQTIEPLLYESVPLTALDERGVELGRDTVDGSLWVALLLRESDRAADAEARKALMERARKEIAGKTLNLGVVPVSDEAAARRLAPGGRDKPEGLTLLQYQIPKLPPEGRLPADEEERVARYRALDVSAKQDVLIEPGTVQITLPADTAELALWSNLDPLEAGVGDFPPALDDTAMSERVITWLRITAAGAARARFLWLGINAAMVTQRAHVSNELLPSGTGEPDQGVTLSHTPVVPGSVSLRVEGSREPWREIDDLMSAGPEVVVPDLRQPPGKVVSTSKQVEVFLLNRESGEVRFGDGTHGKRPPFGAAIRADYDYGVGREGNVGAGAVSTSPALPAALKVSNPVRTWGGAEAETVGEGEKQVTRFLQHRDRLVNAADFEAVTLRTPGVDIGRVEVLPAFNPALAPNAAGDAAGAVTLMVIPKYDQSHPDTPEPDSYFKDAVCAYLNPRRLVTTELFLSGPVYKRIWISVGLYAVAGADIAEVRESVKQTLLGFLSPLPPAGRETLPDTQALLTTPQYAQAQKGWPLGKAVSALELLAVASRVPGVLQVNRVLVADDKTPSASTVPAGDAPASSLPVKMSGLELPRVAGISVGIGDAVSIAELRGETKPAGGGDGGAPKLMPVPVIPDEC